MIKKIIRAADYIPEKNLDGDLESYELPESEAIVMGIFGDSPDYSDDRYEELWQTIFDAEDEDTIAYCLEKGVDVLGDDGEPVAGFRDIAVMLKAIDSGLLKLAIENCEDDEAPLLDTEVEHYGWLDLFAVQAMVLKSKEVCPKCGSRDISKIKK